MSDEHELITKVFNMLNSWSNTIKAFKKWGITSYCVEQDCHEFRVLDGVIYIPPEAEQVVSELIKEITHERQD